jgi:hypothetical protein
MRGARDTACNIDEAVISMALWLVDKAETWSLNCDLNIFVCVSLLCRDVHRSIGIRRFYFQHTVRTKLPYRRLAEYTGHFSAGLPTESVTNTPAMFSTDKNGCMEKLLWQVSADNWGTWIQLKYAATASFYIFSNLSLLISRPGRVQSALWRGGRQGFSSRQRQNVLFSTASGPTLGPAYRGLHLVRTQD